MYTVTTFIVVCVSELILTVGEVYESFHQKKKKEDHLESVLFIRGLIFVCGYIGVGPVV